MDASTSNDCDFMLDDDQSSNPATGRSNDDGSCDAPSRNEQQQDKKTPRVNLKKISNPI